MPRGASSFAATNPKALRTDVPRLLYTVLLMLAAPAAFVVVLLRGVRDRAYWSGLSERFGWGRRIDSPSIWLHAVSLGEVNAAAELIRELRARHPELPFLITTATPTGRQRAESLFGEAIDIRFLPYDTPGSVRRFLSRTQPRLAIIMETELWPNLLHECRSRRIPTVFANARLSAKSVSRYRRLGALIRDELGRNCTIAAQSAEDAERFIEIGADRANTHVTGNLKFDTPLGPTIVAQGRALRQALWGARPAWVAGSTHEGEEEEVLTAHAALAIEGAVLALVPRHPQRFETVAAQLEKRGIRFDRRSLTKTLRPDANVLLVDTMGELATFYAAADAAFVGGSLVPVGGHNLLEPAALGVPVITGPYTANSREIARQLVEQGAAAVVADSQELAEVLRGLFADRPARERMGAKGRAFVEAQRGNVARLLDLIDPLMSRPEASAPANPRAAH